MSRFDSFIRRIDAIEANLEHMPESGEKYILLLPCKDGFDGIGDSSDSSKVETLYSKTIFYKPGSSEDEIERLIDEP